MTTSNQPLKQGRGNRIAAIMALERGPADKSTPYPVDVVSCGAQRGCLLDSSMVTINQGALSWIIVFIPCHSTIAISVRFQGQHTIDKC